MHRLLAASLGAAVFCATLPALGHKASAKHERLPVIGPAPQFTLATHDGGRLSLGDLRDQVVVVTFIYATCRDSCPVLTRKLAAMQRKLGKDFGPRVRFVAITVDPEVDTPQVLRAYAQTRVWVGLRHWRHRIPWVGVRLTGLGDAAPKALRWE